VGRILKAHDKEISSDKPLDLAFAYLLTVQFAAICSTLRQDGAIHSSSVHLDFFHPHATRHRFL
jgi:hypothetical protein